MPSRRVPGTYEPNRWTARLAALRAAGAAVADLTATNPALLGLSPLDEAAAALDAVWPEPLEPDPLGLRSARDAVAGALAPRAGRFPPEHIVLTSSTSESYAQLFRLLLDPGEAVLVPAPSYPLFEPLARAECVAARPYRLAYDGAWHLDRGSLAAAASDGAKAVIVVEPNNPTGSFLGPGDRAFLEETAVREGLAIVADEVFRAHPWPGRAAPPSWLDGDRHAPTFVLGGLSKLCGLPHLKLGWIAAAGPERARAEALAGLEWLADLFLSVGGPVQAALPELLELRHEFARAAAARVAENLALLDALALARPEVSRLPAEGGWSAVLRLPASRTAEEWAFALLDRGVAAHPGDFYDFYGGEHLVVSLLASPGDVGAGCAALAAAVRP